MPCTLSLSRPRGRYLPLGAQMTLQAGSRQDRQITDERGIQYQQQPGKLCATLSSKSVVFSMDLLSTKIESLVKCRFFGL